MTSIVGSRYGALGLESFKVLIVNLQSGLRLQRHERDLPEDICALDRFEGVSCDVHAV